MKKQSRASILATGVHTLRAGAALLRSSSRFVGALAIAALPIVVGAQSPARNAGSAVFDYTATLRNPVSKDGPVAAANLTWDCRGKVCTTRNPWPTPGVSACAALAGRVGIIESYGHPRSVLTADQLQSCNRSAVNALKSAGNLDPSRLASPARPEPKVVSTELARKRLSFDKLKNDRESASRAAQGKTAGNSDRIFASRSRAVDPNRLSTKREMLGYTHRWAQGEDCDDSARDVHPNAAEVCDNRDNDCDGEVDEGQKQLFFLDADGDGHGDPGQRIEACPADQRRAAESGQWLVALGNDCNDSNPDQWHDCP